MWSIGYNTIKRFSSNLRKQWYVSCHFSLVLLVFCFTILTTASKFCSSVLLLANADYLSWSNRFSYTREQKYFECPSINLPDTLDYVVAIGGIPGGGGRTVVKILQRFFQLDFGSDKDVDTRTLDNRHFLNINGRKGLQEIAHCEGCRHVDRKTWWCSVLDLIGPLGTSPDFFRQVHRQRICYVMWTVHQWFLAGFKKGQRVWIFKTAESILFLPLLQRIYGNRFRFILNVRNPICYHNMHFFESVERIECFRPLKAEVAKFFSIIPTQLTEGEKDKLHIIIFYVLLMPVWDWLQQEMIGRFTVVRHEDLLDEEGLSKFVHNIEELLYVERMKGNMTDVAAEMAQYSRQCEDTRQIPQLLKMHVNAIMTRFNYTIA